MKILVTGGDGFCGWPTSLYLSDKGHEVIIADNFSRRQIDVLLEVQSLTPISPLSVRLDTWEKVSGKKIKFEFIDLANEYDRLVQLLIKHKPDTIIHYAEQRAAPYSMKSPATKRYTVHNNINGTHNVLCAIVESGIKAHLVHLGSAGVYGYDWKGNVAVPEGYLTVKVDTPDGEISREILHPTNSGSVYHMTKTLDQLLFAFYAKNDKIRITDLHQGNVWGTQTAQTSLDERLINRFDYDGDYGTVMNRFLMQAAIGYPLTVYGTGGQTRPFIHIRDTIRCIEIAITNPPEEGDKPFIFNQVTEVFCVRNLAQLISNLTGVKVDYLPNPRLEVAENDFLIENRKFLELGLNPTKLSEGLLEEIRDIALKYADRVDKTKILPRSQWKSN